MAQCKLQAASAGQDLFGDFNHPNPEFLITCMKASGFALVPAQGFQCGAPDYDFGHASCYRAATSTR